MATVGKFTLTPSPVGPFHRVDLAARVVFGLIWDRYRLSVNSVLSGDARWVDDNGDVFCVYSQIELAEHSGLTDRTVRRCLDTLYRAQLLTWEKTGFKGTNRYYPDYYVRAYFDSQK